VDDFLTRPFHVDEFTSTLGQMLARTPQEREAHRAAQTVASGGLQDVDLESLTVPGDRSGDETAGGRHRPGFLEAASGIFSSQGPDAVTIKWIGLEAEVAPETVLERWPDVRPCSGPCRPPRGAVRTARAAAGERRQPR